MVSKRCIDEREIACGKSGTSALELFNTIDGKNEIYGG